MQLKCDAIIDGMGPCESIVTIRTTHGPEEIAVYSGLVNNRTLEVGRIREDNQKVLVELPRESATGKWRVWVERSSIVG
jgi:hypothetical protein